MYTISSIVRTGLCASLFPTILLASGQTPEEPAHELEPVRVIATNGDASLTVTVDPRAAAQPIPAQDGAEALRAIPGFNVIRKGGTDGDPVLRGMAGSRLGILLDGEHILGGCGNRMDPPTAYVFPLAYDRVTVLKGPQSVVHGPGLSAGIVLFERSPRVYTQPTLELQGSLVFGSNGRNDQFGEVRAGNATGYVEALGTRTSANDYKDGNGNKVHSQYERWSTHAAFGWTPNPHTTLELTGIISDGEAAYADRAMDGTKFARENVGLRFHRHHVSEVVESIEAHIFWNYVDHVMDNFSLRNFSPSMMMPGKSVSNPDRETFGGRVRSALQTTENLNLTVGSDFQGNRHTVRRTSDEDTLSYRSQPRIRDARFESIGVFAEMHQSLSEESRLIYGVRGDRWKAKDERQMIAIGMNAMPNPNAGKVRRDTLPAGFVRYEHDLRPHTIAYIGLGHAQRFPDYWEWINKESSDSLSAFGIEAEKTTQLDLGIAHRGGPLTASLALFANRIDDFILIQSGYEKPAAMGNTRTTTIARNIDAHTLGGEAGIEWAIGNGWRADAAIAYVHGTNRTDDLPLAQQPPLEGRLGLAYSSRTWSVGSLARFVAKQDRVALRQGNIVGQDLGPTSGFAVFSLNASWKPTEHTRLTGGVDNLFDRTYAEHLSRGGAMVAGFPPPATRVNEPGRTFWVKLDLQY